MTHPSLLSIATVGLVLWIAPVSVIASDPVSPEFNERIARFVDQHQAVAQLLGIDVVCANEHERAEHDRAFSTALRQARRFVLAGNIFTKEVADDLRARLAFTIHSPTFNSSALTVGAINADEESEELPERLTVNDEFPAGIGRSVLQPLLWSLPPLPRELEYRWYGTSLILLDVRANLVIDVLDEAVPVDTAQPSSDRQQTPCNVHPELPACWT